MKLAFVISPSRVWISSISASPRPCAVPPSIWPSTACGLSGRADVLRRADPDDARQAELDVDLGDDAHRGAREGDVGALARDLAGLGIERRRARMAVHALDVDLAAARPLALLERRAAGVAHGAGRHPGHARRRGRAGRADASRSCAGASVDVVGAELGARDLEDHAGHALADLGRGAVHLGAAVGAQHHARRAEVVEALRVADVLEADREADAAPHALAARRVARAARQPDRVARQLLRRSGTGSAAARRITSATGSEPGDALARRQRLARPERVAAAAARPGRCRARPRACPSAPRARSSVCTAPKPRIAPHGGLFV